MVASLGTIEIEDVENEDRTLSSLVVCLNFRFVRQGKPSSMSCSSSSDNENYEGSENKSTFSNDEFDAIPRTGIPSLISCKSFDSANFSSDFDETFCSNDENHSDTTFIWIRGNIIYEKAFETWIGKQSELELFSEASSVLNDSKDGMIKDKHGCTFWSIEVCSNNTNYKRNMAKVLEFIFEERLSTITIVLLENDGSSKPKFKAVSYTETSQLPNLIISAQLEDVNVVSDLEDKLKVAVNEAFV
ncbi:unnamed protein product [Mytilus coruscus]|uniref:Uncharacterized protein n=1 Tax=Mytilus coruscus TaxID=42192 RepID=A0A6J8D003_MYTCO|nr:unnamed protein product [Mytilus coruscus]